MTVFTTDVNAINVTMAFTTGVTMIFNQILLRHLQQMLIAINVTMVSTTDVTMVLTKYVRCLIGEVCSMYIANIRF